MSINHRKEKQNTIQYTEYTGMGMNKVLLHATTGMNVTKVREGARQN